MSGNESLVDFLTEKKNQADPDTVNWEQVRDQWLNDLQALLGHIKSWLADAEAADLVSISEYSVPLKEEGVGAYQAPALVLDFSGVLVRVEPVARLVFGAVGRVDISNGPSVAKLLQKNREGEHGESRREWRVFRGDPRNTSVFDGETFSEIVKEMY